MTFALIAWGGQVPGQRPRTKLAYVWLDTPRGRWMADIIDPKSGCSQYKRPREIDRRRDLLHRFSGRQKPTPAEILAAKQQLPVMFE